MKRYDKLVKRLKPVLDERLKLKQRLRGLQSFLEISTVEDESKILQEYDEVSFNVTHDAILIRIAKIRERNANTSSKDVLNLFELLDILAKIFKYSHVKVTEGWNREKIYGVLEMLVSKANHVKIRQYGLKLVLLVLARQEKADENLLKLYATMVSLDVFQESDVKDTDPFGSVGMDEIGLITQFKKSGIAPWSKIVQSDEPSITRISIMNLPSAVPSVIVPKEGSDVANNCELIQELLSNIATLAEEIALTASFIDYSIEDFVHVLGTEQSRTLKFMWSLFRERYMSQLFPAICHAIGVEVENGSGCNVCPSEILSLLLNFVSRASTFTKLTDQSPIKEISLGMIRALLRSDAQNYELVHEILRQAFLTQQTNQAIYIISTLLTTSIMEGHSLLKAKSDSAILNIEIVKEPVDLVTLKVMNPVVNRMMRRYIRYFRLSISGKRKDAESTSSLLKDILQFYRFLACEKIHLLEGRSWTLLMDTLLNLAIYVFIDEGMGNSEHFETLSYQMSETILVTWIRSHNLTSEVWVKLERAMTRLSTINGFVQSWAALVVPITCIMIEMVHKISPSALKEDHLRHKKPRTKRDVVVDKSKKDDTRPSTGKISSKTSSFVSEKNSLYEIDTVPGMLVMADSIQFSQMAELKELLYARSLLIWKNLICSIGKIHEIKDPFIHSEAIDCIVVVSNYLEKARSLQSYSNVDMPSLFELSGILFKATTMPPEYCKSAANAAGCISRIICRRSDQPVRMECYALYYRLLIKQLNNFNPISHSLLIYSTRLFSIGLPGVANLIPALMTTFGSISDLKGVPELVVRANLSILGSLISYEKQYTKLITYPERIKDNPIVYDPKSKMLFLDLKYGIFDVLQRMLKFHSENNNDDYCEVILWNLATFYLEESVSDTAKSNEILLNDIVFVLLEHISSKSLAIVSSAADGLSLLSENFSKIKIPEETLLHIIDRLVWGISQNLSVDEQTKRKDLVSIVSICAILFKCMLEWLMSIPSKVVANPNIALRISEVIGEAIHVSAAGIDTLQLEREKEPLEEGDVFATNKQEYVELESIFKHLREAAENTLLHLTHHLENFSPVYGPAMMNSTLSDSIVDDLEIDACQYFSLHLNTIIAVIDKPLENKVRLLVRDATGKYAWDMKPFYVNKDETSTPFVQEGLRVYSKKSKASSLMKSGSHDSITIDSDPLEDALLRLQEKNPECLYDYPVTAGNSPENKYNFYMKKQVEQESKPALNNKADQAQPPNASSNEDAPFERARLLLAQIGFLSFDSLKDGKICLLTKSANLMRDIRGLDRKFNREVSKFAIIYVAPGQEDEGSILRNSSGSHEYDKFVDSLGWEVNLDSHPGYNGGLEVNMAKNGKSVYFCSSTIEMMFHDISRIPTDSSDPKQLKKKRHIGNDHVHIIWNEHFREYKWDTIGGDFGNAQIVVTPLPNGMYAIDTYRDELVRPFGPLQSKSVVTKECLGPLVRATAMNAYRNALSAGVSKGMEVHPFTLRKETINTIANRHRSQDNYEQFMQKVLTEASERSTVRSEAAIRSLEAAV